MFFILSKVLGFVLLPSNAIAMLGVAGLAFLVAGFGRIGRAAVTGALLLLAVAGWSPLGDIMSRSLENRFPPCHDDGSALAGIIILGGALETTVSSTRDSVALNDAAERMTQAVMLARLHPEARLVFTGGEGALIPTGTTEAAVARRFFAELGLLPGRVQFESQSRNTAENAENLKPIVQAGPAGRWLLVTSAWHMPRSVGVFRAAGLAVTACPVDYRTAGGEEAWLPSPWLSQGLSRVDMAAREWVGLLAYYATGRSTELFPAP